jgi:peptide chain release factor 3
MAATSSRLAGAAGEAVPEGAAEVGREGSRRRTFAIISHPDAGKTTLSEKLLLYGGAVVEAGSVNARANRREVVSDWMEIERQRGISVTSTVMRFEFGGVAINLLDTPGHRDFSEDTLRVLGAADSAVILLDAAKGIEERTLKLFQVARERHIPLITFINKFDRPGLEPLALLDEIESTLGLRPTPVTWPVGPAGEFAGVVDRRDDSFHRFQRTSGGSTAAGEERLSRSQAEAAGGQEWETAADELALLDAIGADFDAASFLAGESTPILFGSALSNFGVRLLLDTLVESAPPPGARTGRDGAPRPTDSPFSALVFKVQANLDPRHRDRLAFIRLCSGRFERGMKATVSRTGRPITMNYAHELFGQQRETLDVAYPGDVVGLVNAGDLRVGDTLYVGEEISYPPIPTLAPDHFARIRARSTSQYKQFRRGLDQLREEGVVHVFHESALGRQAPVLAGAGPMQFEVARHRFESEFGAEVIVEPVAWHVSRVIDPAQADAARDWTRSAVLESDGGPTLAVFKDLYVLAGFERAHPEVTLDPFLTH